MNVRNEVHIYTMLYFRVCAPAKPLLKCLIVCPQELKELQDTEFSDFLLEYSRLYFQCSCLI